MHHFVTLSRVMLQCCLTRKLHDRWYARKRCVNCRANHLNESLTANRVAHAPTAHAVGLTESVSRQHLVEDSACSRKWVVFFCPRHVAIWFITKDRNIAS